MSEALTIAQLVKVHTLMLSMLEEAVNANWQELNRLDSERRVLLENKNNNPLAEQSKSGADYEDWCQKILALDTQINDTVLAARQQLIKENRELTAQMNAKKGYQTTATIQTTTYGP